MIEKISVSPGNTATSCHIWDTGGRFPVVFSDPFTNNLTALLLKIILIAPSVPIYQNFVINDQELPNSQHYLPQYYNSIGSFFQGKLNFSRVIFLPLNFTTYGRALTVVPSNHLFYVAAGSVNNNGNGPTNISVLQDVFQSIIYGNADRDWTIAWSFIVYKYS